MSIELVTNEHAGLQPFCEPFGLDVARRATAWHATFPEYAPTPLVQLGDLARDLGLAGLCVKDESGRFGLGAFKVLGGSYAIAKILAARLGVPLEDLPYDALVLEETRRALGDMTFVAATDGNHGRGVAWTAERLRQKAVVYLPQGSASERVERIRALGVQASTVDMNYDDAVRFAAEQAQMNGWVLVQDTSWEGYQDVPRWIMEGYTTMALELVRQLGDVRPTHVFLQAGVGAMSGAVTSLLADFYGADMPTVCIVEPATANCLFRTAQADDGMLHAVQGDLVTVMDGLACGEPCPLGWDVLRRRAAWFFSVPEWVAAEGMRVLAHPRGGDASIESGASGACTTGLIAALMSDDTFAALRDAVGLDAHSVVACISTEGA